MHSPPPFHEPNPLTPDGQLRNELRFIRGLGSRRGHGIVVRYLGIFAVGLLSVTAAVVVYELLVR